jgi:hypothetical protein
MSSTNDDKYPFMATFDPPPKSLVISPLSRPIVMRRAKEVEHKLDSGFPQRFGPNHFIKIDASAFVK